MWFLALSSVLLLYHMQTEGLIPPKGTTYIELFQYAMKDSFPDLTVDMDKLIREYTKFCPYLSECDYDHLKGTPPFTYSRSELSLKQCPPCDCTFYCMKNDNCCPGSPYQFFRFQAADRIVVSHKPHEPDLIKVIGHCPTWHAEDEYVIMRCQGDSSLLFPVSSTNNYLTYKNRYCAACHNETDFFRWPLGVYCGYDHSTTVTIEDILNPETPCLLRFPTKDYLEVGFHALPGNDTYGRCNVSGLWEAYDPDVEWACENMNYGYYNTRNIFCYICNPGIPSLRSTPLVDACNVTGKWDKYQPEVEHACQSQPQTTRLFPFKNIHCKICNGGDNPMPGTYFKTTISEDGFRSQVDVTLTVNRIHPKEFLEEVQLIINAAGVHGSVQGSMETKETFGDASDVLDTFRSACGRLENCSDANNHEIKIRQMYCPESLLSCRCDSACVESAFPQCCSDTILKYNPYTCASERSLPTWYPDVEVTMAYNQTNGYSIIDQCLTDRNVNDYFALSNETSPGVSLQNMPITTQTVRRRRMIPNTIAAYKNLTYWLCNSREQHAFMDFEFYCNSYIDHSLYRNITDLMQVAKDHCVINFFTRTMRHCKRRSRYPHYNYYKRYEFLPKTNISQHLLRMIEKKYIVHGKDDYSACNQTGEWKQEDLVVKYMCEANTESLAYLSVVDVNGFTYKNFACFLCNPPDRPQETTEVISTCNVTGAWEEYSAPVSEQCDKADSHDRWFPFKNFYCSECNLPAAEKHWMFGSLFTTNYLFGISEMEWLAILHSTKSFTTERSAANGTSLTLMCAANHILQNGSCQAAYPKRELTYILSFGLRWQDGTPRYDDECGGNDAMEPEEHIITLENVINKVTDQIFDQIKDNGMTTKGFYTNGTADTACNITAMDLTTTAPNMSFSLTLGYIGPNVTELEQLLVGFLESNFSIDMTSDDPMIQCTFLVEAFHRPLHATPLENNVQKGLNSCYYSRLLPGIDFLIPGALDTAVGVDRLLLCPQLEFSSDEFHYNNKTGILSTTDGRMTFDTGYFKLHGTFIRICANHYWNNFRPIYRVEIHFLVWYYYLFSYCVIGFSLAALAMTFATYCLFSPLRTLPGKTIMVLTFCLFIAQACLMLSVHLASNTAVCQAMGIMVHYFWLATFFAMNVCSIHLFDIFCRNTFNKVTPSQENKRFLFYLLYTFGMPFAIVATIICVYSISSNGDSVGYGRVMCFLSDIQAKIAAFLAPVAFLFLSNTLFFSLAFHKIRTTPNVQSSRKSERKDLVICIRICAIIGITCPLYFLNSLIGFSYFTFVVEGINSLQGLYIFLSYVCNRRVLTLYKQKFNFNQ